MNNINQNQQNVFLGSANFSRSSGNANYFGTGKDSLRLISLGGAGNVTKNMYVYEYRYDGKLRDILIVDCGVGFPEPEMYGVDLVIPDIRYLSDKKDKIRGIVFTHGHDDHIGGISYIYPKLGKVPMWGTRLTAAFTNIKLAEAKIKTRVTPVEYTETLRIGVFTVSFVRVTHSIPDAANLIIETPVGIFYHGSDYKFDFNPLDGKKTELEKINAIGRKGVLCLLSDCLGSERRGFTASEQIVNESLEKELAHCSGKFIFTTQSSNISRIQSAIEIAISHRRQIAFFGRSMDQNIEESVKLGYMRFPREMIIRDRDLKRLPPTKQFLIVAGSQGQPESALTRMANDNHKHVTITEGDTVLFSADPIPGNEHNVQMLIEQLYRKGARVSYSDIMEDVHVSGHGSQADLMLMLSAIGPKYIIPIGGTYSHIMQYRRLAEELGYDKQNILIPEDGEILEFSKVKSPRITQTLELENIMVDGLGIGDVGDIVLRDRQTIAAEGIVVIVVPIDTNTGKITADPDIITRGFIYVNDSRVLIGKIKQVVLESLKLKKGRIIDWHFVRKNVEENVAFYLRKETGREPLIVPVIVEV
jgi:ribonuclease J